MEFLKVFLYVVSGFSLMSLKDISNVRHLDMEKLIFVKSNRNVVKMITQLKDDYILVVKNDINNFLNVPVTFVPTSMNFTPSELLLFDLQGQMLETCNYDYIINYTSSNMITTTMKIREEDERLYGSVSSLNGGLAEDVPLNITSDELIKNYIDYIRRFKKISNKYDSYNTAIMNTFKNYDLVIGL